MFVSPVSNLVGQVEGLRAQLLGLAPTAPSMCDPPPTFDALVSTGALTGDNGALIGGAAVGMVAVFAPYNADAVGVYDVAARTFDSVPTGALTINLKFAGAAAVGTVVAFAPSYADAVGVFDVASGTFDASVTTGALTMNNKFIGAAAVGTVVAFAPYTTDAVGVYDVAAGTFDASVSTGALTMNQTDCTYSLKIRQHTSSLSTAPDVVISLASLV